MYGNKDRNRMDALPVHSPATYFNFLFLDHLVAEPQLQLIGYCNRA
jgi:hypothetical protein